MINMPISDYPVSSDPRCSAEALGQRKAELIMQQQNIADSNLSPERKTALQNKIENEKRDIDAKIRRKENEISYNKKLENKRIYKKTLNKKELFEQTADTDGILDKRV